MMQDSDECLLKCPIEVPCPGASNEKPKHFLWRNKKNIFLMPLLFRAKIYVSKCLIFH